MIGRQNECTKLNENCHCHKLRNHLHFMCNTRSNLMSNQRGKNGYLMRANSKHCFERIGSFQFILFVFSSFIVLSMIFNAAGYWRCSRPIQLNPRPVRTHV